MDHPRSRGVYVGVDDALHVRSGSSPLARGLRPHSRRRPGSPGIIPARAGFTGGQEVGEDAREDHPRSRGVYIRPHVLRDGQPGSSPLARGLQGQVKVECLDLRIIPARAGFT